MLILYSFLLQEVKSTKRKQKTEEDKPATKKPKKEDENTVWDLGNNRQVTVRDFRGRYFVDIREMYFDKDGDLKPTKKGNTQFLYKLNKIKLIVLLSI